MKWTVVLSMLCTLVMVVSLVASGSLAQQVVPQISAEDLAERKFAPWAKVGSDLADLYDEHQAYLQKGGFAILGEAFEATNPIVRVIDKLVVIDAAAAGDPAALLADLEALGLQNGARFGAMVSGRLPLSAMKDLAALDSLRYARPAYVTTNVGLTTSQGDPAMRAGVARAAFGVDGAGVTVGVLSDSFDCLGGAAGDVTSGDLPSGISVLDDTACPGTDEGRAMMQLIRDVAPGAGQGFHTAFNGQADFANGIVKLAGAGAKVIVDDVIYFAEPMFQDGIVAQAVDTVKAAGVAYFSSAGNQARKSYQAPYVAGAFHPGLPAHGPAHDFDPGPDIDICQSVTLPLGATLIVSFQWDEPYFSASGGAGSSSDIDIFLSDATCTKGRANSLANNVGSDPVEFISYFNPSESGETEFNIVIANFSGPNPGLMKYVEFGSLTPNEFDTASSTIYGHANAAGAEAVGAAFYGFTPAFGADPALLEGFSSAGPTPILFDLSDTRVLEVRPKPEIVAPDGTNTTFFRSDIGFDPDTFPNFFGTSAAAPHAAAVAALLKEADPTLTPADIYAALEDTALDMGPPGFDDDSGFGLIQADSALEAIDAERNPVADLAVAIADAPDPVTVGGSVTYSVTVTNNGPDPATGVILTDTLPGGVTFVSASPGCLGAAGVVACTVGALANLASAARSVVVNTAAMPPGPITNTVTVAGNEIDPVAANNTAIETTVINAAVLADLSVTKVDAVDPVTVGDNVSYTLTATNNGPSAATGVVLTDTLPGGVTFVSASPGCLEAAGVVTCTVGALASLASAARSVVVTTAAAGTITNTVTVVGNETNPVAANNTASEVTTINVPPVTVPQVTGLSQAQAEAAITAAGLTVGTVTAANSATVPAGDVISQDPAGGTSAAPGNAVDLVVSLGPAQVATPTFSPDGRTFRSVVNVTIATGTPGAAIRYTTDGGTPTPTTGTVYVGPVPIAATTTLKAMAHTSGLVDSAVKSATYVIEPVKAMPWLMLLLGD